YHTFVPLLYQVATAELEPEEIAYPIRKIIRKWSNVRFIRAEVTGVDTASQIIHARGIGDIRYDYLIIAVGGSSRFFNIRGASEYAFQLRTLNEAIALRNHILTMFEQATCSSDPRIKRRKLTFVIIGGGPTGVEIAGTLMELLRGPLWKDYRELNPSDASVVLIEAKNELLPGLPARLCEYALNRLQNMGVQVLLQKSVTEVFRDFVQLHDGERIPTETTIWTAGVRGNDCIERWGMRITHDGRVHVLPTLQLPDHHNVYVIGDSAYVEDEHGMPLPMIAPVAIQEGSHAARSILAQIDGGTPKPFRYRDVGMMVVIGRNAAAVRLNKFAFTGFSAWMLWLFVHLAKLIGFKNKLFVLINWGMDYILRERAVRLILP
ncbi:MAG TPA: NAD(P)/FAD-dependent oxidoreductase, partial [Armatimonadetes bacterium]|nr:NAD(P)/FAD-dependent oxidoreductase [Armatimonadota bacterium]